MENTEMIKVNDKQFTKEEFETEKKRLTEQKIELVEVQKNVYKTRLHD